MMLFSRSFVRRRVISLATTATVGATSLAFAHGPTPARDQFHGAVAPIQYVADRPDLPNQAPFLAENRAAMTRMMAGMTVKPTGDADRNAVGQVPQAIKNVSNAVPEGSAIVNAAGAGPIRQVERGEDKIQRRYPMIGQGGPDHPGAVVQARVR